MRDTTRPVLLSVLASVLALAAEAAPLAYVTNEGGASVSVIDTATDKVVNTLKVGKKPRGLALTADGKRLFVSDQTANALIVIDLATGGEAARVALGDSAEAIYLSADGKWLSAAIEENDQVLLVDTTSLAIVCCSPAGCHSSATPIAKAA